MNLYGLVAIFFLSILFIHYLGIQPSIKSMFEGLADIFSFEHRGNSPMAFDLGIFLGLLIFIAGIMRIIFQGKRDDE